MRSCLKTRKRLSTALAKANEVWRAKKRQRIDGGQAMESSSVAAVLQPSDDFLLPVHSQVRFHARWSVLLMNGSLDCRDPYNRGRGCRGRR